MVIKDYEVIDVNDFKINVEEIFGPIFLVI